MMAVSAKTLPVGADWTYEVKWDGYRAQAIKDGRSVSLASRNLKNITRQYPAIAAAASGVDASAALLDGEIVVEDTTGHASFPALQADLSAGRTDRLRYFLFDILYCEGFDLTGCSLGDRKALLGQILQRSASESLHYSEHLDADGPTVFEHACRLGLEGIVSKRVESRYKSGRCLSWVKVKNPGYERA